MKPLDDILSGQGEALPAPETAPETVAPAAETPTEPTEPAEQTGDDQKMVPHAALHAEKQKVKRYTEEVAATRAEVAKANAEATETRRLLTAFMEQQRQTQPPQQAPDWFEKPDAATMHVVGPHLERVEQALLANAKMIAGTKYGDDKVDEAEKAFIKAINDRTLDQADYHKVVNSPNRYAAAAQWHARRQALEEIGDDPAAYKERLESEIREKLKAEQPVHHNGGNGSAIMPSNLAGARNVGTRAGPAWAGPTPINDIFKR